MNNETISDTESLLGPWLGMDKGFMVIISAAFAIGAVVLITIIVNWAIENKIKGNKDYSLYDVIYDAKGFPSLSKFQFLLWTLIILFSFLTVGFIRIFGGFLGEQWVVKIPENLIYLLGISISVVPTAAYISKNKYGENTNSQSNDAAKLVHAINDSKWLEAELKARINSGATRGTPRVRPKPPSEPPKRGRQSFWSILLEGGIPSLTKFQMFSWTWIAVGIYGLTFLRLLSGFASGEMPIDELLLPDVSSTLVALMGVSQGAYVAGKWVAPKKPSINTIYPETQKIGGAVTIEGVNFGEAQGNSSVLIDNVEATINNWKDTVINCTIQAGTGGQQGHPQKGERELVVIVGGSKATTTINII